MRYHGMLLLVQREDVVAVKLDGASWHKPNTHAWKEGAFYDSQFPLSEII